jgi:hypothetical protein
LAGFAFPLKTQNSTGVVESYEVFTPLQLVLAVVKFEPVCQWSWAVKGEYGTYETKNHPNHQPHNSTIAPTFRQRSPAGNAPTDGCAGRLDERPANYGVGPVRQY